MKLKIPFLPGILILFLAVGIPLPVQGAPQLTTTLLPVEGPGAAGRNPNVDGLLWIQNDPRKEVFLQFDLSGLDPGMTEDDFKKCTLRLVARNVVYEPPHNPNSGGQLVIVKGRLANDDFTDPGTAPTVISLSTLTRSKKVAIKATEAFRKAVYQEYRGDKKITLLLFSDSHKASSLLFSSVNSGMPANPSNLPRLVIEYTRPPPEMLDTLSWRQHQHNPEHSGRNSWIPFQNPEGFSRTEIDLAKVTGNTGTIADYPLAYRGRLYLVYKILDRNYLYALDFKGDVLWRRDIGTGTVQRSPVISPKGLLYVVTEKKISSYNLNTSGQPVAAFPASADLNGKLAAYTDLTSGNDGSLFFALQENALNYIYGLTSDLKPFLKSDPQGPAQNKISTVTVRPDGRAVFAQNSRGAVTIDIANPSLELSIALQNGSQQPWEYYHVPVAGPTGGIMIFADFTGNANQGNIWGYTATKRIWNQAGTLLPQPVLGSNGLVYFIQNGGLQTQKYNQIGSVRPAPNTNLKTTSNLVMDGADNIYFWDSGYLHGYDAKGKALFAKMSPTSNLKAPNQGVEGPEQFLRLMLGPDGTLWANNKNGSQLFAFKPIYAASNLALEQEHIKTNTAYRATGSLTVGSLNIASGNRILLQAQKGISFSSGFAVKRGTELLCRTGF